MSFDIKHLRVTLKSNKFILFLQKYIYLETLLLVGIFVLIGYVFSPEDICLTEETVPYLLILLSIITLFHGFESGMLAIGIVAVVMWFSYEIFPYVSFLVNLLMVMIFSEFHYFWTSKIKEFKTNSSYTTLKLNELANAFYLLKISHDQLEKNYVLKPMSIRSAIEEILNARDNAQTTKEEYFVDFLSLLEKSFHMESGFILYAKNDNQDQYLTENNSEISYGSTSERYEMKEVFKEYLVNKAINYKQAIYVSDEAGDPAAFHKEIEDSKFLAAIPIIYDNKILALLVIEKMPFMAFNRENLISLSIVFEYLLISILKHTLLNNTNKLLFIKDKDFRYEYIRASLLQQKYKTNSTILAFKIKNEIQSVKLFEKAQKMLRSLDILTLQQYEDVYFILFLFPLNDKAVAIGFLNRLLSNIDDEKDKKFEYMIFNMNQNKLLEKYITEDYHD